MPKPLTLKPRRQAFLDGFSRSKRGNLWRHYRGLSLTVFRRQGDGWYAASLAFNKLAARKQFWMIQDGMLLAPTQAEEADWYRRQRMIQKQINAGCRRPV